MSENGEEVNFLQNSVKLERLLIWKNYDGKIIECCFDKGESKDILDSSFDNFCESAPVKVECVSAKLLDEPDKNLSKESKKRPSEDMSDPDSMIVNPKQNKFLNLSFDKSSASVLIIGVRDESEKKPFEPKGVKHVACVVGVEAYNIKKKIAELCGWKKLSTFPGGQPVSLTQDNIEFLKKFKYQVTWRADGTRFMMLIQGEKTYLCSRDYKIYEVFAKFYSNKMCLLKDTLLDGVLVLDKWKNKKSGLEESRYNFLIYDIISYDGKNIGSSSFNIRLDCIQDDIIEPRTRAKKKDLIKTGSESFRITKKEYFKLEDSHEVFRGGSFFKQLTHDTDGLIFQPVDESYKCGQWSKLLKWKQVNTAGFRLKIEEVREYGQLPRQYGSLLVSENGEEVNFLQNSVKLERLLIWKNYDGKIIECCFDKGESKDILDSSFDNFCESAPVKVECVSAKLLDEPDVNLSKESKKRPSEDMSDPDSMIVNPKQNKFLNLSFDKSSASVLIIGVRDESEKKPFEPKGVKHVACVVGVEAYNIKKKLPNFVVGKN